MQVAGEHKLGDEQHYVRYGHCRQHSVIENGATWEFVAGECKGKAGGERHVQGGSARRHGEAIDESLAKVVAAPGTLIGIEGWMRWDEDRVRAKTVVVWH